MIRAISLGSKRVNIDGFEMKYWNPTLILFFEIKCTNFQKLKSVILYPILFISFEQIIREGRRNVENRQRKLKKRQKRV